MSSMTDSWPTSDKSNGNHLRHCHLFASVTNLCNPFTKTNNLLILCGTIPELGEGKICNSCKKLHKLGLNLKKGKYHQF